MAGSGFGFQDDELQKLFADAEAVVKKAKSEDRSFASPSPQPEMESVAAPSGGGPAAQPEGSGPMGASPTFPPGVPPTAVVSPPPAPPASPPPPVQVPRPANTPAGSQQMLIGGSLDEAGIEGRGPGSFTTRVPWGPIRFLALGRVPEGQCIALSTDKTVFYFIDSKIDYRGLIPDPGPTGALNWRKLVELLALRVNDQEERGIQALQGGGGLIPRYETLDSFLGYARSGRG